MSCDNIQGNGHVARAMFTAFARLQDPAFADWMDEHVAFPNSMVDRITPVTADEDRAWVRDELGIEDAWPVVAEPFFQWVLEDDHPAGRPPYEDADVQLVEDVEPYELMKLRLLNACHQGLCYFGYLSGYRYAHEATQDPAIATFLRRYMDEEGTPTLQPGARHRPRRLQVDPHRALPEPRGARHPRPALRRVERPDPEVAAARRAREPAVGRPVTLSAGIVASWARYDEGTDESGEPIEIVDRLAESLHRIALTQREDRARLHREPRRCSATWSTTSGSSRAYRDALDGLIARRRARHGGAAVAVDAGRDATRPGGGREARGGAATGLPSACWRLPSVVHRATSSHGTGVVSPVSQSRRSTP